jgi:hypothetical protein
MRSVLHSLDHEWEWQRPILGPSYWTCSFTSILVISDILPPLSDIQIRYPSVVQRVLDGIDEIRVRKDRSDWEIYFLGISCIYVNHAAKVLSRADQSLDDFILQIQQWGSWEGNYGSVADRSKSGSIYYRVANQRAVGAKLRMEQAYWAYLRSHPNHHDIPDEVVDESLEQLGTSYSEGFLSKVL